MWNDSNLIQVCFLVVVYLVFPGRTDKKRDPLEWGPLASLILFGLFNDSINGLKGPDILVP